MLYKYDLGEPAILVCGMFFAAALLAAFQFKNWKLNQYGGDACAVIITGVISFLLFSFLAYKTVFKIGNHTLNIYQNLEGFSRIDLSIYGYLFMLGITTFFAALFFIYYLRSVSGGSLAVMISSYKSLFRADVEQRVPAYVNLSIKMIAFIAYLSSFVFAVQVISKEYRRKDIVFLYPVLLHIVISLLTANRGELLSLIFAIFVFCYITEQRKRNWSIIVINKYIKRAIVAGVIVVILFWSMAFSMGTANKGVDNNFLLYICNYISGALASIDLYLKQGGKACEWFGQETFVTLNNNLSRLFHTTMSNRTLEFRYGNGYAVVNIYTSFRRFFHDFGLAGVVILSGIQGFVFTKLYQSIRIKPYYSSVDFLIAFYCYFIHDCIFMCMEDSFYSQDISFSGILRIILFYIIYRLIFLNSHQSIEFYSEGSQA